MTDRNSINNTASEIEYLDGVVSGKWGECDKALVLRNYIKFAYTRKWSEGINVDVLVTHANKLLKGL